jgi:hypothetical protein
MKSFLAMGHLGDLSSKNYEITPPQVKITLFTLFYIYIVLHSHVNSYKYIYFYIYIVWYYRVKLYKYKPKSLKSLDDFITFFFEIWKNGKNVPQKKKFKSPHSSIDYHSIFFNNWCNEECVVQFPNIMGVVSHRLT